MAFFKKKLTEHEIANAFVHHLAAEGNRMWPQSYASLREVFPSLVVSNENRAAFDLVLAAIALDLQAINNLFPPEQAERLRYWVVKALDVEGRSPDAANAIEEYHLG